MAKTTEQRRAEAAERMRAWRNGLTVPQLRAFLDAHDHRCDICGKDSDPRVRAGGLVIDHDHTCCGSQDPQVVSQDRPKRLCGKCIRGLLCIACNAAIGQFADRPDLMERAIAYLGRMEAVRMGTPVPRLHEGESHHQAKLTVATVTFARAEHAKGKSIKSLARRLDVTDVALGYAVHGRTWRHVPMPDGYSCRCPSTK